MVLFALRNPQIDAQVLDERLRQSLFNYVDQAIVELPTDVAALFHRFRAELKLMTEVLLWLARLSKGYSIFFSNKNSKYLHFCGFCNLFRSYNWGPFIIVLLGWFPHYSGLGFRSKCE